MPQRHEPESLKSYSMKEIVYDFDYICYGCKNKAEMAKLLEDDSYKDYTGPFREFRKYLTNNQLINMFNLTYIVAVYNHTWCIKYVKQIP